MIETEAGTVGSPGAAREAPVAPPVPKMRRLLVDGWAGVAFTALGLSLAPTLGESAAWRNATWVLVVVPAIVGVAALLSSLAARRRVHATLGAVVVAARDGGTERQLVHMTYAIVTSVVALAGLIAGGATGPRVAGVGGQLLWLLVGVLVLSPAGVWTVILDGATMVVGLLRIGSVLVAALPMYVAGFFAGYLGFILGSVLFGPDLLAWFMASIFGITVGYTLSILPLHLLALPSCR